MVVSVLTSLCSAAVLALCSAIYAYIRRLSREFELLKSTQKNQLRSEIVRVYTISTQRGYISPMELDMTLQNYSAYAELGGNSYIHILADRCREMEIKGEPIP